MRKLSKLVSLMLSVVLCIGMASPAFAITYYMEDGDVYVGNDGGKGVYSYQSKVDGGNTDRVYTKDDNEITITQRDSETATQNTITVKEGVDTTITLKDVNIKVSDPYEAALSLTALGYKDESTHVTINLEGKNTLKSSGDGYAGLALNKITPYYPEYDGASVTIQSSTNGSLTAEGGKDAAGIGGSGSYYCTPGNITISGNANVTATGGENAAGIGSGSFGIAGNITISGNAKVTATGGKDAAGIGSSIRYSESNPSNIPSKVGNIVITDNADVTATGGERGAGIGGGYGGTAGNITIEGNANVNATGGKDAAGIGSGSESTAGNITISGDAKVTATGGVGSGYGGTAGNITIGGNAQVNATGVEYGAGIGSGSCGTVSSITIKDGATVKANGGKNGAGIGSGSYGTVDDIEISSSGTVTANNGENAQAIGNGSGGTVGVVRVFQNDGSLYYQNEDSAYTFTPPEGDEITIGEDGTISLPAGTTSVDKDGKTQVLCTNAVIDENGKPASDEHAYDVTSTATCTNDGVATYTCSKCNHSYTVTAEKLGHTPGEAAPENVIEAQPGVEGSYDLVVRCTVCGEIINSEHLTTSALPVPAIPDDSADAADTAPSATIADQEVPLAGLVSREILISYLYVQAGSPDGEDAEGEYVKALAWAVANGIIDQDTDPEEVVTVAILRDVMTRYAKFLDVIFDVEIPGEDDEIVMNCNEILEKFFASQEEKAA